MAQLTVHDCIDGEPIKSIRQFIQTIEALAKLQSTQATSGALWFRGQKAYDWKLIPSIGRKWKEGGLSDKWESRCPEDKHARDFFFEMEEALLQRFRRYAYPFEKRALSEWEALTIGQHHYLPTRLLDWTSNPLVALFFATLDPERDASDGAVFAFRPRRDWDHHLSTFEGANPKSPVVTNPFGTNGQIKIVYPMLVADRLIAQSGAFTIQDPRRDLMERNGEYFADQDLDVEDIHKWMVCGKSKLSIHQELHRLSINERTLFPGLDGIAKTLRWQEGFRS